MRWQDDESSHYSVRDRPLQGVLRHVCKDPRRADRHGPHPPDGDWMTQTARNLLDPADGFLRHATHLIHDRDPVFTEAWTVLLKRRRDLRAHSGAESKLQPACGAVRENNPKRMFGALRHLRPRRHRRATTTRRGDRPSSARASSRRLARTAGGLPSSTTCPRLSVGLSPRKVLVSMLPSASDRGRIASR